MMKKDPKQYVNLVFSRSSETLHSLRKRFNQTLPRKLVGVKLADD